MPKSFTVIVIRLLVNDDVSCITFSLGEYLLEFESRFNNMFFNIFSDSSIIAPPLWLYSMRRFFLLIIPSISSIIVSKNSGRLKTVLFASTIPFSNCASERKSLRILVYGIVPLGHYITIYIFASIYLLAILGLGLLLSTYAQTQQQSMLVSFFITMIFNLLSGLYTPIESMPVWAQIITKFNPVSYFIEVMRMVVLKRQRACRYKIPDFCLAWVC